MIFIAVNPQRRAPVVTTSLRMFLVGMLWRVLDSNTPRARSRAAFYGVPRQGPSNYFCPSRTRTVVRKDADQIGSGAHSDHFRTPRCRLLELGI